MTLGLCLEISVEIRIYFKKETESLQSSANILKNKKQRHWYGKESYHEQKNTQ